MAMALDITMDNLLSQQKIIYKLKTNENEKLKQENEKLKQENEKLKQENIKSLHLSSEYKKLYEKKNTQLDTFIELVKENYSNTKKRKINTP